MKEIIEVRYEYYYNKRKAKLKMIHDELLRRKKLKGKFHFIVKCCKDVQVQQMNVKKTFKVPIKLEPI